MAKIKLKRKMGKKGMFFTLLAIAMISLFMLSYTFYSSSQERKAIQKRVQTLNSFVFSTEQDLRRQLYVAGFRTIFLFEKKIIDTGFYVPPPIDEKFNTAFFNATIYGESNPSAILTQVKFSAMLESVKANAEKVNVDINMTNPVLTVTQDDPWRVKFNLTVDLTVKDKSELASWKKRTGIIAYVPIEYFVDPIYAVETNNMVPNKILKSPYPSPIGPENILSHAQGQFYINSTYSPSFLDRLQGNLNAGSDYGIESIVNKINPNLPNNGDKSSVDYIYFNDENNPSSCSVNAAQSWLRIDSGHLDTYGVSCT